MIISVTLNPAVDLSLDVPDWEEGAVNRAASVEKFVGGKGINISRVLGMLNIPTTALTIVGSDSVNQFQRLARLTKVPIVYISVPGEIRTNIHIADSRTGRILKVNQSGSAVDEIHFNHFKLLFKQHLRKSRYVGIGGSLPPGLDVGAYGELVAIARNADVPVLLDAVGEPLLAALEEKPLIVKPNRHELETTLGAKLKTTADIIEAARELQERGARGVVVSDGGSQVLGLWDREVYTCKPPKITVVGPTGAGDSLAAGILAGLNEGLPFPRALKKGVATSTATCLTPEGQLARIEDVERLEGSVGVKDLEMGNGK